MRIEAAKMYQANLKHTKIKFQQVQKGNKNVYHIFSIRIKKRDQLNEFLRSHEIGTGLHYPKGLSKMKFYQTKNQNELNDQEYINELLSLPMFPFIKKDEVDYVSEKILNFIDDN